jgi:hypothetical protein
MCRCGCEKQNRCCNSPRRYFTKDEEIENLKTYKKELEKEIKAVEEKIQEMTS